MSKIKLELTPDEVDYILGGLGFSAWYHQDRDETEEAAGFYRVRDKVVEQYNDQLKQTPMD